VSVKNHVDWKNTDKNIQEQNSYILYQVFVYYYDKSAISKAIMKVFFIFGIAYPSTIEVV